MMTHRLFNFWILLFVVIFGSACTSVTEQQGAEEIMQIYGGSAIVSKGANAATNGGEFQGKYVEVSLDCQGIGKAFSDLRVPASYCAALMYSKMTSAEQQQYSYFKVSLKDLDAAHTFNFKAPELKLINAAAQNINSLLINLQTEDHAKVLQAFNLSAIDKNDRANLSVKVAQVEKSLAPISNYTIVGSSEVNVEIGKQKLRLVRLFTKIEHAGKITRMVFVVNPTLHPDQPFLFGLQSI